MAEEALRRHWRNLIAVIVVVIFVIPIKRYSLPGSLPFDLEPYRVIVALVIAVWVAGLLVDPRVRLVGSHLEAPLALIVVGIAFSEIANPHRVATHEGDVLKSITFMVSFFAVFWMIVSVIRSRDQLEAVVKVLVGGGAVLAIAALWERRTGANVFNHLSVVIPFLHYRGINGVANEQQLLRGGHPRAIGPAQHPIAFSVLFVMLLPLAVYLAHRYGRGRWVAAAVLLILGVLATASRTGIVALIVVAMFFVLLQRISLARVWPAIICAAVCIQLAVPGAYAGIRQEFFPKGGLVANQADVTGNVSSASGRLAKFRPAIEEWSRKPLAGEGFGTRIPAGPGRNARILDDQWLGTLLETGFVGALGWLWLLGRAVGQLCVAARRTVGADSWLFTGLAGSIAAFGVTMATYDAFSFIQTLFVFFILLALGAAGIPLAVGQNEESRLQS